MINNFKNYDFHNLFFSSRSKNLIEKIILNIALFSFILHLGLIIASQNSLLGLNFSSDLLNNAIVAIYTPFSFILLYEVYLLVYYLPQSFTFYLSKQYEIITLIVFRRFFKDIASFDTSNINLNTVINSQIFYDLIASLILFFIVYLFNRNVIRNKNKKILIENKGLRRFVAQKEFIAALLIPLFFLMALYSFYSWSLGLFSIGNSFQMTDLNQIFFEDFFNILIFVDIIILLLSFFYSQSFHKIIRNSGFIVSTIIIRISFGVTGIINLSLIISALLIGLCVLVIHNLFEEIDNKNDF
ncbi:MAG: hypothetical protein CMG61_03810 [Candidatus Marinimicrobia bacterium]|nr:hypothetical protein [Candidatus Neomarinimicrobiota bacterium]